MKILIAYGSLGKFFHLKEFSEALQKLDVQTMLVKDSDYSTGFPSKKPKEWIGTNKKFKNLISEFKPDAVFIDRQSHFGIDTIKFKIPLFILLRGHYWSEIEWAKKTLYKGPLMRTVIWFRNNIAEKCFRNATAVLPICKYLEDVVKEHHPNQSTFPFLEGIDAERWYNVEGMELKHPCVGLLQDANWWGKTKEMLILKNVLKKMPNLTFYWAGDGPYTKKIIEELKEFENFKWLGRLQYPNEVSKFLAGIDVYALISGMDLAPLTLKEAQLMEKPVVATNVGGIYEMMEDKKTGFLINENESEDLIEKLTMLFMDKNLRKKMGINGRQFVIEKFNWNIIAEKFIENIKPHIKN